MSQPNKLCYSTDKRVIKQLQRYFKAEKLSSCFKNTNGCFEIEILFQNTKTVSLPFVLELLFKASLCRESKGLLRVFEVNLNKIALKADKNSRHSKRVLGPTIDEKSREDFSLKASK